MAGNTVGTVRKMLQDLPEDMEFVIEDSMGNQYEPYQCGLARCLKTGPRAGSYVFDGEDEEANLGAYDSANFMLRCG
jgi:hypothetical protein